jgi:hypothetical protein
MKSLLLATITTVLAVGTPYLAWREYAGVAEFVERASDGQLSVTAEAGNKLTRGGRRKRTYDASIDGIRVQIVTSESLAPGQQYPIIFSSEELRSYSSQAKGIFSAYKLGRKAESTWSIFAQDYGAWYLFELVGLELLWIIGAWVFWRSSSRRKNAEP